MRDCENCVYARPFGGENDNRCSAWSCEFIDRHEAIEAYETLKAMSETKGVITTGTPIIPISSTLASTKGNDMGVIDIRFGQGCKGCEYADKCPDAFTEISHHCGAYGKGE